ncbi:hypothetical protein PITC_005520 [Penicillium italicum]|uniref:Uncharacterized protein n=1 Tax=Penicillium italicum TaxID=40296 RepID=A0A0A2LA85_PENIT|nr:hypothetical protein PITC_005520 [Penicillium italicum]
MAWVQSISRRSLHRARSGLSALRSRFSHHSSEEDSEDNPEQGFVSPVALRRERQRHGVSSGAYTSDTQEDMNFGAELSRMNLPTSSPSSNTDVESLIRRASSLRSIPDSFLSSPGPSSTPIFYPPSRAVSNSGVNSTYTLATDHDLDFQFGGTGELEADMDSEDRFAHTRSSTENNLIQQTWGIAISTDKEIEMPAHELEDHRPVCEEQQATHLQQENINHASSDTQTSDDKPSSIPISRQSSAEVRFAFPGIYHEALHQWARQHDSPSRSPHTPTLNEHNPNTIQRISSLSQHSPSLSQHSPRLYGQEESPCASQTPRERILLQDDTHSNLPQDDEYDEGVIPLAPPQTPITHSEEMQPFPYPNPLNFISNRNLLDRWSSISETATTQRSSVEDYSSRYTPAGTTSRDMTSTEVTSMESMSNDTWSPWSPVDSELLFPSPADEGNEYFLVNGKTTSQYPDRGNQPVKSAQHTTSRCGNTRAPQELTELISPGIMSLPLLSGGIPGAGLEFVEEDTDDEFYPGIVQPRQLW